MQLALVDKNVILDVATDPSEVTKENASYLAANIPHILNGNSCRTYAAVCVRWILNLEVARANSNHFMIDVLAKHSI